MCVNKIENRIKFKIKTRFHLVLLTPETMKLPRSTESKIKKDKNGENVTNLEITEVVLVYCNIINNDYQDNSRVLHIDILLKNFVFLKFRIFIIEVWFTDQNSKSLEIEDKLNNTLVVN